MPVIELENIYEKAKIISDIKLCAKKLKCRDTWAFWNIWKKDAKELNEIIDDFSIIDSDNGKRLRASALLAERKMADPTFSADLLEAEVVPLLFKYMKKFNSICENDGKWKIFSSETGFLSLKNERIPMTIHSGIDPLSEARELAETIYDADCSRLVLFGGGLGYLPYALWEKSKGTIYIYVYEPDSCLVDYAINYGFLSYIDADKLHVYTSDNPIELIDEFNKVCKKSGTMEYVSDYCIYEYDEPYRTAITDYIENKISLVRFKEYHDINWRCNKERFCGDAKELIDSLQKKDCIIVAAGPSLSEYYDWIKAQKGKKIIVAVSTVLKKLLNEGIIPDIVAVADPNENIYPHIEGIASLTKNIILLAESVAYWRFLSDWEGKIYRVLGCGYEKTVSECAEKHISPWILGGTVSSMAIEFAIRLRANNIYLIGLDLAYPGNKCYADGMPYRADNTMIGDLLVKSVDGDMVPTNDTFDRFRRDIEKQIQNNKGPRYINCSRHGAYIEGTDEMGEYEL